MRVRGVIANRVLLNYRCKASVSASLLPDGLTPSLVGGAAEAWLFMLRAIGWRTVPALLGAPPLRRFTEFGYRVVARHRHRLSQLLP